MTRHQLDRRSFLRGAGVALSLPLLEGMHSPAHADAPKGGVPKRFVGVYVGHGFAITMRNGNKELRDWSWYPREKEGKLLFGHSMAGFNKVADQTSVFYGLEHPRVVGANGHGTADSFLTGSSISDAVKSPSLDQVAAAVHGRKTRFPSLVLGNEGGLGSKGVSKTLSYDSFGRAIPSTNDPRYLYDQMFNPDPKLLAQDRNRIGSRKRMVDLVLESHKRIKRRLGRADSAKLDQYLATVRAVEKDIERMEAWVNHPKPQVPTDDLSLKATVNEPELFIRTMYNLIYLAFKTDSTRYATYMLQSMGGGAWGDISRTALGLSKGHHGLAHEWLGLVNGKAGAKVRDLAKYDQFQGKLLAEFVQKLADTPEGDGTMLDRTIVYYGSSNSKTHVNRDYPLLVCGGSKLGLKHGTFHKLNGGNNVPLSNLYVRMLHALDVPVKKFSDSTGMLKDTI